jgi:hypothetical protein
VIRSARRRYEAPHERLAQHRDRTRRVFSALKMPENLRRAIAKATCQRIERALKFSRKAGFLAGAALAQREKPYYEAGQR